MTAAPTYRRTRRRPDICRCGKIPYPDEASALAAAERRSEHWDNIPIRVYKCPEQPAGTWPRAGSARDRW
jgi:hypothetical protein